MSLAALSSTYLGIRGEFSSDGDVPPDKDIFLLFGEVLLIATDSVIFEVDWSSLGGEFLVWSFIFAAVSLSSRLSYFYYILLRSYAYAIS